MDQTTYRVEIELVEDLLGGQPKNKSVYASYIATKAPAPENGEEEIENVQEVEERGWTGFPTDDGGPFLYDYQVHGFLKESARTLKQFGAMKQLRDKFARYVVVRPRKIRLPQLSGVVERPLRAQTAQGPRVTVARSDYIKAPFKLEFNVVCLDAGGITEKCLKEVLSYGEFYGLGQWRGGGHGRFKVLNLEEI